MTDSLTILVQGAAQVQEVPNLASISRIADIRFASDRESLWDGLPGAEILFGWDFRADDIEHCWEQAGDLKWIHWGGAGVDAALFAGLRNSDVMLTNSRGIFDRAMAEWALGVMIAHAKHLPESLTAQREKKWNYQVSTKLEGQQVLIVGVGSIGREVGRVCRAFGLEVSGVGRQARDGDDVFDEIFGQDKLHDVLKSADYVVLITPLTEETRNLFDADTFAAMKSTAQFINLGRGPLVDEAAMIEALDKEQIAGAALDVFCEEPLRPDSPIWTAKNTIISPHMSGDYHGFDADIAQVFLDNFQLYRHKLELRNIVDKSLGFVPSTPPD